MKGKTLPRYLRVAHWLYEQQRPISSREVADVFCVAPRAITDDFAKIRKRRDIIHIHEEKIRRRGVAQYRLHVLMIHPYVLDGRQSPRLFKGARGNFDTAIAWRSLISNSWHKLLLCLHSDIDSNA